MPMLVVTLLALRNVNEKLSHENGKEIAIYPTHLCNMHQTTTYPVRSLKHSLCHLHFDKWVTRLLPIGTFFDTTYHCLAFAELLS